MRKVTGVDQEVMFRGVVSAGWSRRPNQALVKSGSQESDMEETGKGVEGKNRRLSNSFLPEGTCPLLRVYFSHKSRTHFLAAFQACSYQVNTNSLD